MTSASTFGIIGRWDIDFDHLGSWDPLTAMHFQVPTPALKSDCFLKDWKCEQASDFLGISQKKKKMME